MVHPRGLCTVKSRPTTPAHSCCGATVFRTHRAPAATTPTFPALLPLTQRHFFVCFTVPTTQDQDPPPCALPPEGERAEAPGRY
eukprot:3482580-Pyramimonas_sp.AAC.1